MDYYLYHKQRTNLLNYSFKDTLKNEIGSRHEFSSKKADVSKWNADFKLFMNEIHRVLKPKSKAIIILGDSQINGKLISAADITRDIALEIGFKFNLLESVSMTGKSKMFNASFQRPNKFEHTIELTK
jgi:site-specific DNA-methyltransferase (cytosine-N4-specific)